MTQTDSSTQESTPRARSVFKADHPRGIDGHISFFGDSGAPGRDMCGEALLDALMGDTSAREEPEECA